MKKISTNQIVTFSAGLLLGLSILVMLSFSKADVIVVGGSKISLQDAKAYFNRYYSQAEPNNQVIKGFALNRDQLDAMNRLLAETPSLAGFRIYMGIDNNSATMGIVVGIDNDGKDNSNSIYRTVALASGPCPTICDGSSTITAK